MNAPTPPARRLGPYELLGALGAGGMGEVWLARDTRLQREVALKVLPQRLATDRDSLALFRNEALALASLNHANIAIIHGLEEVPGGPLVLVLERVEGESLATRLARGPLAPEEALQVGVQIAQALEAAHERGVVHRDLKPANVMLAPRGLVKVLDFGLAKRTYGLANTTPGTAVATQPGDASASLSGPVAGTPGYMSPEQVLAGDQGPRTDLFAFGCVLYECLTGARAFPADDAFVAMAQVLNDTPDLTALPVRVSPEVRRLLESCLEKQAEARPPSARAVRHVLEEALGIRRAAALREGEAVTTPHNLPSSPTPFIGRETTLAECTSALATTRLLTLTGIGGSGKTRLALELARQQLEQFRDGVWFVDLAPLTDSSRITESLAAVLGVRDEAGRTLLGGVIEYLRTRHALVLFDNAETHPEASATLVMALLSNCPEVKALVTDREPLGAEGETLYLVPTLELPPPNTRTALVASTSEAVRLFVARARVANPAFELTNDNAAAVADLCRHLDGIPLALELAAARVRMLTVDQMRARLGDRFKLLARAASGAPSRQQTVLAVIKWSWDHLLALEQDLMRRLAVFTGGWTLERAAEVCSDSGDEFEVLDLLTRLAERSLVVVQRDSEGHARYRFLESVWRFAADQLESQLEHAALREKHLAAYVRFAERAESRMAGSELGDALREYEPEEENVLAAASYCAQADDGIQRGMRLTAAMYRAWSVLGRLALGRRVLEDAITRDTERKPTAVRAKALTRAAGFALVLGEHAVAERYLSESLALSRTLGDAKGEARALAGLGALAILAERYDDALPIGEQSLSLYERLGEQRGVALGHHNLGSIEIALGNHERARERFKVALEMLQSIGDEASQTLALCSLAYSHLRLRDLDSAREQLEQAISILERVPSLRDTVYSLSALAELLFASDRTLDCARMLGAATMFRSTMGMPPSPLEAREESALRAGIEHRLGAEAMAAAIQPAAGLTLEAVLAEAGQLLESLRPA